MKPRYLPKYRSFLHLILQTILFLVLPRSQGQPFQQPWHPNGHQPHLSQTPHGAAITFKLAVNSLSAVLLLPLEPQSLLVLNTTPISHWSLPIMGKSLCSGVTEEQNISVRSNLTLRILLRRCETFAKSGQLLPLAVAMVQLCLAARSWLFGC